MDIYLSEFVLTKVAEVLTLPKSITIAPLSS